MSWDDAIQRSINALSEGHQAIVEHLNNAHVAQESSLETVRALQELTQQLAALSKAQAAKQLVLETAIVKILANMSKSVSDPKMAIATSLAEIEGLISQAINDEEMTGGFGNNLRYAMDTFIARAEEQL
jgi:hypothetical protein